MLLKHHDNTSREMEYRLTIGSCVVASQLIFIILFSFWPVYQPQVPTFDELSERKVDLDMIEITRQRKQTPPPPPTPQVPVPRPNDYIVDDMSDLEDLSSASRPDFGEIEMPEAEGDREQIYDDPETSASVTRIVEPVVPDEARRANIKAEITVTILVDKNGKAEEVSISKIRVFNENDDYEIVQVIGYGLIEATLDAAQKWKFRPAENGGEKVRALSRHIFTYGIR
ncbi:MAG: energy transducer TonB [Balneolales bacterium]